MIAKILNYFDIDMPNVTYKYLGSSQEFSQRILTNMNYFWDANLRMYYLRLSKHGRKVYNLDDLVECGDDVDEAHMKDEQPMGVHHDVLKGGATMQDAPQRGDRSIAFDTDFDDTSFIMTMLKNMQTG